MRTLLFAAVAVGTIVSCGAIGRVYWSRRGTPDERSPAVRVVTSAREATVASGPIAHAGRPMDVSQRQQPATEVEADERAGGTVPPTQSFQEWLTRYLATNPDLAQLRGDLERALAELPDDPTAANATEADAELDAIRRAGSTAGTDYRALLDRLEHFLEKQPQSQRRDEANQLFVDYARRWDEHDFDAALAFSAEQPGEFAGRVARYREYIERHGAAGRFRNQAQAAIDQIETQWADEDYRAIHEFSTAYPNDLESLAGQVRRYVSRHPASRHRSACERFLAQFEKATTPRDYRVRVKSGKFTDSIARAMSRGPDLAVEVEVAGVRVGRTPVVPDSLEPNWDYEFPQRARWRLGDTVRIRVMDFDYRNRTVLVIEPHADDPLAMRFLTGRIAAEGHELVLESDFEVPNLPAP